MATVGVLRPCKTGGFSLCRTKNEKDVGKRKCNHVLTNANFGVVKREKGMNIINIDGISNNKKSSIDIEASTKEIANYIKTLSTALSDSERKDILAELRS